MRTLTSTLAVLMLFAVGLATGAAQAQNLPSCPADPEVVWNNCFGTYTLAGGDKYVGEFRNDSFDGQGTFTYADGTNYVGEFRDDLFDGQGTYTYADGTNYVGEFRDGLFDGQGTFTYADGDKYVGEFRDDMFNGQGTLYAPDGTVLEEGFWNDDELVPGDLGDGMAALSKHKCQEALGLLLPLAKQSNADAQFLMGQIYDEGECVPEDNAQAVQWYRLAAKQGNEDAQYIVESYDKFEISGNALAYVAFDDDSIEWADAAWLEDILLSNPNLTTMKLTSDGGDAEAGYEIADIIIDFELNTHVVGECLSACTILFLAGESRIMERGSKLGFHQSRVEADHMKEWYAYAKQDNGWLDEFEFAAWLYSDAWNDVLREMKYLVERGVSPEFAIQTLQADPDDMWYPTRRELQEANVIRE